MGVLDSFTGAAKREGTLAVVASFGATVEPHTNKAGVKSHGFKIFPILADGTPGRFGDHWIRVSGVTDDDVDLTTLDAYITSLDVIVNAYIAFRSKLEAAGAVKPLTRVAPKAKAAPPAPPAPPEPPAPPAKRSVLEDILGDLPA